MTSCLSGRRNNKQQSRNRSYKHPYTNIDSKAVENEEWKLQQTRLLSLANAKPNQYLVLSQKELHDVIGKVLSKYPRTFLYWHWIHGRFEPVLTDTHEHSIHARKHSKHSSVAYDPRNPHTHARGHLSPTSPNQYSQQPHQPLLRMNGQSITKCHSCFKRSMKHEYFAQNDVLYLVKYAIKLFVEYRTERKHQCLWRDMALLNPAAAIANGAVGAIMHSPIVAPIRSIPRAPPYPPERVGDVVMSSMHHHHVHTGASDIDKFHAHFKHSKPILATNAAATDVAVSGALLRSRERQREPYIISKYDAEEQSLPSTSHTSLTTKTTTHLHERTHKQENSDYFVPRQYIKRTSASAESGKTEEKESKSDSRSKKYKQELTTLKKHYRLMLKDYNKMSNFLSRKGLSYDSHGVGTMDQGLQGQLSEIKEENLELRKELARSRKDKQDVLGKYELSLEQNRRLKIEIDVLRSERRKRRPK